MKKPEKPTTRGDLETYRVHLIEAGQDASIQFDCQAEDAAHASEQAQNAYPGATVLNTQRLLTVRLTLTSCWATDPDEDNPLAIATALANKLRALCATGGLRQGNLPLLDFEVTPTVMPPPLALAPLAAFMHERIATGDLSAEDVPARLAQFGLMDPAAFVAEMRERMDLAAAEAAVNPHWREPEPVDVATLHPGDLVDLVSCPYLRGHPTAAVQYATVVHVEHETAQCVAIGYEGIDTIGYPVGTHLLALREAAFQEAA